MVITIAHTKGGVGKSILAWNLAVALKAKVIDLDFQKTLVLVNNIRENNQISPLPIIDIESSDELYDLIEETKKEPIIIDVGGFDSDLNRMAIYAADMVITPASDKITELAGLKKFEEIIQEISLHTDSKIEPYILINNVNPNAKNFSLVDDIIRESSIFQKLSTIVFHRAPYYRSLEHGIGVVEMTKSKAKDEILSLVSNIQKVLNEKKD